MNGNIKRYVYIIGTICMVFFIGTIVLNILPWLLLAGFITYMVVKVVGFFKRKKEEKNKYNSDMSNSYDNKDTYQMATDDYTSGEVIDVEYEDVDNKKD